ncbi:C-type LECtin [Caenorhabditis elegans]|uniref:C-type LECtin n=1 Tax=Caenorhabditis elegans TaxID=6239 RepID=Q95QR9_CAEEL|nr:C-type LECtin [Caenorhabditis elegans]CCD66788.1 C-type LECtin [Caenorhabditis elegans]|eukprot:NP_498023.1 C-type LECtin [Caenorhabditis elegans]
MIKHLVVLSLFALSAFGAKPLVCTNGFTLINNKCLRLFSTPLGHSASKSKCMEYGATLVTVKNAIENNSVSKIAASSSSSLWIGLYCFDSDVTKCMWDDSTGSAEMYNSFASGFPHVDIGKCVYHFTQGFLGGKWLNGDCDTETRAFVCELTETLEDSCEYNYNGHCYSFHQPATFAQAQVICEQECGNLASIHSSNENRYLSSIISSLSNKNYYIGASWPSTSVLTWLDGSTSDYNNISPSSAHEGNCALLSSQEQWLSSPCTSSQPFVCKRSVGSQCFSTPPLVTITPTPPNPSSCNSTLLMAPGKITSPNFPSNYGNNQFCSYHLSTLGSYRVALYFLTFTTEFFFDFVVVYDGDSASSPKMGNYSGSKNPFALTSTGNNMFVTFKSDHSNTFQGFDARFQSSV